MTRARFTKTHFKTIADCISMSLQSAGKDVNTPYEKMFTSDKAKAFDNLMQRLIDAFKMDNDLFKENRFREAAGLE